MLHYEYLMLERNTLGLKPCVLRVFVKVKGLSQLECLRLRITPPQMLSHMVLMSSFHWPNDK